MSRTIRRTHFNKKKRFFQHYWEAFSDTDVLKNNYIELWKYHSDNYYTKSCKNNKQFFKTLENRKIRRHFKSDISHSHDIEDFFMKHTKCQSIKWKIH